jgi:aryl-alcohol dehydrogenase
MNLCNSINTCNELYIKYVDRPLATAVVVLELHDPFRLVEVELDFMWPNEVLVEVRATSICATDGAVQHSKNPVPFPAVLGHEGACLHFTV